jgi:integrase
VPLGDFLNPGDRFKLALVPIPGVIRLPKPAEFRGKATSPGRETGFVRLPSLPGSKQAIDAWTAAAGITQGKIFRAVRKGGKVWGEDLTPGAVLQIVQQYARAMGLEKLAPHDMRRTCAKLCRKRGGDLEQIKFLLGHASIQTTERYLGAEQDFVSAVNDNLGLDRN